MKHIVAFMTLILLLSILIACQEEQKSNEPLTDEQELNMKLVNQENVKIFGAPPLIPTDHPFEIGEDLKETENGGTVCLDCHYTGDEDDAPQTLHPERHNCIQCHIPANEETATAEDFNVENEFIKHVPK